MPVPSAITDLSTTAGSNSPAGTDPIGTDADNYIRAHAAFIAALRDGSKNLELATATAPALAFTGDSNTGIYSSAADKVSVAAGGTKIADFNTTGPSFVGNTSTTGIFLSGSTAQFGYSSYARQSDGAPYWLVGCAASGSSPDLRLYNNSLAGSAITIGGGTNYVTKPYQPSFYATGPSSVGSTGVLTGFTEAHDVGSNFNASSGVFTAPVTGRYLFNTLLTFSQAGGVTGACTVYFQSSNSSADCIAFYCSQTPTNGFSPSHGASVVVQLSASDTMSLDVTTLTNGTITCRHFSGALLF